MRGINGPSGSAGFLRQALVVGAGAFVAGPVIVGVTGSAANAAPVDSVSPPSKSSAPSAPSAEYISLARAMDVMNQKNGAWNGCSRGTIEILETGSTLTADAIPELPLHVSLSEVHECLTNARTQLETWIQEHGDRGGVRELKDALDEAIAAAALGSPDSLREALKKVAHRAEEAKPPAVSDGQANQYAFGFLLTVFALGLLVLTNTDGHRLL